MIENIFGMYNTLFFCDLSNKRRSIRIAIPNPGFKITPSDNAMVIPPSATCKILVPLGDSISSVLYYEVYIYKSVLFQQSCRLTPIILLLQDS
jgi:hypothetical protein